MGEGTYDEHSQFDLNNSTWTVSNITVIFTKLDKQYHATMYNYTKGTGGSPGDDASFAAWQQQDEHHVV
jgi:hypothetical protein